jgi:hypothetical protein
MTAQRIEPFKGIAPDEVGDSDDLVPQWLPGVRPFDDQEVQPPNE